MLYEIDEKIIKQARKCPRDHVCLTGKDGLYCKVAILMKGKEDEIPLLDCDRKEECPYCESFGESYICQCPVRKEVFKQYGA